MSTPSRLLCDLRAHFGGGREAEPGVEFTPASVADLRHIRAQLEINKQRANALDQRRAPSPTTATSAGAGARTPGVR